MTMTRGDTPLHPQVAALLEMMDGTRASRVLDVASQRAFDDLAGTMFNADVAPIAVEREIRVGGADGELRALLFSTTPASDGLKPIVLHMHGGGFVLFKPETTVRIAKAMATHGDAIVVSLDYRRAPEHPYPAPLDDCVAAFRWLRANAASIGGDASRIAVAGDSAGASLAGGTALRLIADGEAPPDAFVSICGWLDLTMSSPSSRRFGPDDPVIDDDVLSFWRGCYTPDAEQWRDPMLSPVFGDLSSFPPSCVVVGGIEPFRDEGAEFAEKLRAAGGDAELHLYDGMPHWFPTFPQITALTDWDVRIGAFLKRVLAASPAGAR